MNLHVFYIHITIMLLLQYAFSKTLPEASEIDSEPGDNERSDETEAIHEAHHRSLKHTKDSHFLKRHSRRRRADDDAASKKRQCAVMYKNEEPVGILQAYKDSYQLLPIHSGESIPVDISPIKRADFEETNKRDTEAEAGQESEDETMEKSDSLLPFSDDKYPNIFAKFKIDSRVEKDGNQRARNLKKRESKNPSLFSEKHVSSLRSTLSRIEENDEGADAELKGILNDMGLIDDSRIDKREAELIEDEDLEHGTNKINLIKIEDNNDRSKRSESENKPQPAKAVTKTYGMIEIPEPNSINEDEYIDQYMNKHPEQFKQVEKEDREKRSDDVEEQMERQIKERLQKIKEEVRNEIDKIKANNNDHDLEESEDSEQEETDKSQRRKRNAISSLVDEETSDLNPVLFGENNLIPHIRRRRNIAKENIASRKKDDSLSTTGELKNKETYRPLKEERFETDTVITTQKSANDKNEDNLIIDLNPRSLTGQDNTRFKNCNEQNADSKNLLNNGKGHSNSEAKISTNQYFATTTDQFLIRNLKEYRDEINSNYDDNIADSQSNEDNSKVDIYSNENTLKDKRGCKCSNKGCKCDKPKVLIGSDGTNFLYFDGAPRAVETPFVNIKESDMASMMLLPQPSNKKRAYGPNDNHEIAKTSTKILRGLRDGGYTLDLDPDIYKISEENPNSLRTRNKRNSFVNLVAIHGGGPMLNHLVAIRERSMLPRMRIKRMSAHDGQTDQQLTLTDMSDEDLFGALPQSFEGELARFKRVKRAK